MDLLSPYIYFIKCLLYVSRRLDRRKDTWYYYIVRIKKDAMAACGCDTAQFSDNSRDGRAYSANVCFVLR